MIVYLVIAKLTTCSHYLSVTFCRRFCVLLANILVCICDLCSKNVKSTLHVKSTAAAQHLCPRITQYYVTSSARSGRDQSCGNLNKSFLCVGCLFSPNEEPFLSARGLFVSCFVTLFHYVEGPFLLMRAIFGLDLITKKILRAPMSSVSGENTVLCYGSYIVLTCKVN